MGDWIVEFKNGEEGQALARMRVIREEGHNFIATFRYGNPDLTSVHVVVPLATVRTDTLEPIELDPDVREWVFRTVSTKVAERYDY